MGLSINKISQQYLDSILKSISEIIIVLDENANYLDIVTSDSDDLVDNKENLIGKNVAQILPEETAAEFSKYCELCIKNDEIYSFEYSLNIKKGVQNFSVYFSPMNLQDMDEKAAAATIRNITELKRTEQRLKEQKAYFEQLFNNSTEAIVLLNNKHQVLKINKKFANLFGFKESELKWKNLDDFILPGNEDIEGREYTRRVKNGEKIRAEGLRKNKAGDMIHVFLQSFPINLSNGQIGIYNLYHDISRRKERQKKIEYLSFHDEMTGVYNRRYFENEIERLNSSRRHPISIIIGDLDGLKKVNDNYGHKRGDKYIVNAADILSKNSRKEDIIARIGGDEFAVILPATNHEAGKCFCERIMRSIDDFNEQNKPVVDLSISLGLAVMEDKNQSLKEIFNKADQRMYINKGRK